MFDQCFQRNLAPIHLFQWQHPFCLYFYHTSRAGLTNRQNWYQPMGPMPYRDPMKMVYHNWWLVQSKTYYKTSHEGPPEIWTPIKGVKQDLIIIIIKSALVTGYVSFNLLTMTASYVVRLSWVISQCIPVCLFPQIWLIIKIWLSFSSWEKSGDWIILMSVIAFLSILVFSQNQLLHSFSKIFRLLPFFYHGISNKNI